MKKFIIIFLILLLILGSLYFVPLSLGPLNGVLIYGLEKRFDADIDVESLRMKVLRELVAEKIKITGKDGLTLFIEKADFSYNLIDLIAAHRLPVKSKFVNLAIYGKASILGLITDLLQMEMLEDIKFSEIKGTFFIAGGDTITQDLTGISEEVKFKVNGVTRKDNSINLLVRVSLNDSLTGSIPKEIKKALLEDEEGPWMGLSLGIEGDYKRPSFRLLNKLFRLDITTK